MRKILFQKMIYSLSSFIITMVLFEYILDYNINEVALAIIVLGIVLIDSMFFTNWKRYTTELKNKDK